MSSSEAMGDETRIPQAVLFLLGSTLCAGYVLD